MTVQAFTEKQIEELTLLRKDRNLPHYVYRKIDALYKLNQGIGITAVAELFETSCSRIYDWKKRFIENGLTGMYVEKGKRGPKQQVNDKQLADYVHQTPQNFGLEPSRWTLRMLADTVPCLKGMTEAGVHKALRRIGITYKRAQPWQTSPDKEYESKKKAVEEELQRSEKQPDELIALFQDELTVINTADQAPVYGKAGRIQPRFPIAAEKEKKWRLGGAVNATTGEVFMVQGDVVGENKLIELFEKIRKKYGDKKHIAIIMDNWFTHKSKKIEAYFALHTNMRRVWLPTYSPWLNKIEKLWKMLRQQLWHANRFAGKWDQLLTRLSQFIQNLNNRTDEICSYLGLKCPPFS